MKYLFYIAKIYSIPIIKPLVAYLQTTEDDYAFFVSQKVLDHFPVDWSKNKLCHDIEQAIHFHPDFVIVPGNFVDFRIPGIKVQIFHGVGVEKKSHYKIRHFFDVYLTSGPFVTERFNQLQKKYKYFLVHETGWPKIDYILKYPMANLKENLGVPLYKKVILYAPTFSPKMQSASELLAVIPKIVKDDELWFIKFHELMDKEIVNRYKQKKSNNLIFIDSYDITPFLHIADVMISDTSSVVYEFMVLDKPVITFRTQSRPDKGININQSPELRAAIDRSLANPVEFHENRLKNLKEINPYLDGNISEQVFKILIDIKLNNKLPTKKKPLNMFRKAQVLYHDRFKKGYIR